VDASFGNIKKRLNAKIKECEDCAKTKNIKLLNKVSRISNGKI
jgi:hypothetical protein